MKVSQSGIRVLRNFPSDAEVISHKWLLRAGYIVQHASGIYSFTPLFYRVYRKISRIVEQEIDRGGGCQVQLPLLQPAELWRKSGRWKVYEEANLMFQVEDRKGTDYGLCPTAEEVVTDMAMSLINSPKQLPVIFYQQHTKFRDELRPRFGLVRCREFTMMDAYSFDIDEAGLDLAYKAMDKAYRRIFDRCGLEYVVVKADSGAIGGSDSEEFMATSDIGEDTLLVAGDYSTNAETAVSVLEALPPEEPRPLKVVETPGATTIAKLCKSLEVPATRTLKTILYKAIFDDREEAVAALIRGDKDINEVKLLNHLDAIAVKLAEKELVQSVANCAAGYVGPTALAEGTRVVADETVRSMTNFVAGCGQADKHAVDVNHGRDFPTPEFVDIRQAEAGETAPNGQTLKAFKGIEVGHIFKLGDKYSVALEAGVNDSEGKFRPFQMGCYGIGTTRIASAVVEQYHDENGITWPVAVAPYHVHLIPMKYQDEEVRALVDKLCEELDTRSIEYLLDDRSVSGGVKFADADAIGIPFRVVFGRGLANGTVELKVRRGGETGEVPLDGLADHLAGLIAS
jgi:prolyl-tRNA synthetase